MPRLTPHKLQPRPRLYCFDFAGLFLVLIASLSTSLLFALEDEQLTLVEAARAFLQAMIAAVAYGQSPYSPFRPQLPHAPIVSEVKR